MEKYKIDPQSKWWYVILAGLFAWYAATKADVAAGFLFFYIIVFVWPLSDTKAEANFSQ